MWTSSYVPRANQYKVQLHCHSLANGTTGSDGGKTYAELASLYTALGYDALAITDHDINYSTDPDNPVNYDAGDYGMSSGSGMGLDIPAMEETGDKNPSSPLTPGDLCHINNLFGSATTTQTSQQGIIDAIKAAGGIASLTHPNYYHATLGQVGFTDADLDALTGLDGQLIEVFNGIVYTADPHNGETYGTARAEWERLLNRGFRIWAVAVDDYHGYRNIDEGWVVVNADDLASVKAALSAGNFYASSGPDIAWSSSEDGSITVTTSASNTIKWYGGVSGLLRTTTGTSDTYSPDESEGWVRVEVGSGADTAWSQPLFSGVYATSGPTGIDLAYAGTAPFTIERRAV